MNQDKTNAPSAGMSVGKAMAYSAVAFAVGIAVGWFLFAPVPAVTEEKKEEEKTAVSETPLVLAGENSVAVDDQLPGGVVEVKSVKLRESSWVAIHEAGEDGQPGKILGAQWFPAGENTGTVALLRPTVDAGTYFAVIHADSESADGKKVFDPKVNTAKVDDAGDPISFQFLTTVTPAAQ